MDSNSAAGSQLSEKISKEEEEPRPLQEADEIIPALQRFSPARRRYPSRTSTPNYQQEHKEWATTMQSQSSLEPEIDLRLRPVLPRKLQELPTFSASEAWQALGSHRSTSEGLPQEPSDRFPHYETRFESRSHWTPRQDLLDDSDVSSDGSEEAVVPKIRPDLHDLSPRFSLPTVMFSKMRPIGGDISALQQTANGGSTQYAPKKQSSSSHETFRRFLSKRSTSEEERRPPSDSNWTFGLQERGRQYSSDLMLSDKKKFELMAKNHFSDFLGDILLSKADHMRKQMRGSESSNFSFYSTEGQIMFQPERGGLVTHQECSLPMKGRVYDIRKKFDGGPLGTPNYGVKKKYNPNGIELGRRRDLELAKMLEDEVRRRRNKEKVTLRQQLQRLKHLESDENEEDEAYFTEPKSREDSPFFASDHRPSGHWPLTHWQSSPALLEDSMRKMAPANKGRFSMSSVMSSPDPDAWTPSRAVDSWLVKREHHPGNNTDHANDGDVSSSPTPAPPPPPPKKERRRTNIYKQLMDIVRKEERHLKKHSGEAKSMDSCYSRRESSPSTCSESSSTSSYSYSDSSSGGQKQGPANKAPSLQVAFVQPYSPHKSYRPVPFEIGHRMPGLQEERNHLQVS